MSGFAYRYLNAWPMIGVRNQAVLLTTEGGVTVHLPRADGSTGIEYGPNVDQVNS